MAVYREVPYGRARFEVDLGAGDPSTGYGFFHVVPPRGVITVADASRMYLEAACCTL